MMWLSMVLFAVMGVCVYPIPHPVPIVVSIVAISWLSTVLGFWLDRGRSLERLTKAVSDSSDVESRASA